MRKLYDFELLLPINIKSKFKILLVKISSSNFLYVLCLNKKNNKKIIFGYTLSGIKFSKSAYGFYDNINFTEDGNERTDIFFSCSILKQFSYCTGSSCSSQKLKN